MGHNITQQIIATHLVEGRMDLKGMTPRRSIHLDWPFGDVKLHSDLKRPVVFLADGIGMNPFMSIIKQTCHDRAPYRLFLFYLNRRPEDAAFLSELTGLDESKAYLRLISIMTAPDPSRGSVSGEAARLGFARWQLMLGDLPPPVYYSAGPPGMIAAIREMLKTAGIDAGDIRIEKFSDY